jgi:hypothetical protein
MKRTTLLAGALLLPRLLSAQAPTSASTYVAADAGVAGDPTLVGATVGWEAAHTGLRLSVGVDAVKAMKPAEGVTERVARDGLVNADLDAVLFLANARTASMVPYAVAGLGVRAVQGEGSTGVSASWGAGAGIRTMLVGPLAMETEIRYREPLTEALEGPAARARPGLEVRAGLSLRFGRGAGVAVPAPVPAPPLPLPGRPVASSTARARIAQQALSEAERHLGVRYVWGGNTPGEGFDCSGFVRYVYRLQGVELPRVSRDQARAGQALPLDLRALEPGDLIAFASRGTVVDHIAIYAGQGRIIHSSSSGGGVRYDDLNSRRGDWYRRHMVAVRRVIPEGGMQLGGREE